MKIGILTRNENAWHSAALKRAVIERGLEPRCFSFSDLTARIGIHPMVTAKSLDLKKELGALIVRPIGRGSVDEVIFRLDVLHRLDRVKLPIINNPSAIERAVDKYYTLSLLMEGGVSVPRTVVTENPYEAVRAFERFGGEAIVKPLFGSRGIGVTKISDIDVAERIFRTLNFYHHTIYIQEFIPHGVRDIRAFVIGDRVVAAMHRISNTWKTNIWRGATPKPLKVTDELEKLSLKAAGIIGCEVAGIDLLESERGILINEINSQPGWRGLQSTTDVDIANEIIRYSISRARC